MKLSGRQSLHLAAGAAALPAVSRFAAGAGLSDGPVRMIVPVAAGGGADITARLMGQWLSERLGQRFVIEKRLTMNKAPICRGFSFAWHGNGTETIVRGHIRLRSWPTP
jgi:hypothetical protein